MKSTDKMLNDYKDQIIPIFRELKDRQRRQELWRDIQDKGIRFYVPVLYAFRDEVLRLYDISHNSVSSNLLASTMQAVRLTLH